MYLGLGKHGGMYSQNFVNNLTPFVSPTPNFTLA